VFEFELFSLQVADRNPGSQRHCTVSIENGSQVANQMALWKPVRQKSAPDMGIAFTGG
jgi:hypothetical protein